MMKKFFYILFSVVIVVLAGCKGTSDEPGAQQTDITEDMRIINTVNTQFTIDSMKMHEVVRKLGFTYSKQQDKGLTFFYRTKEDLAKDSYVDVMSVRCFSDKPYVNSVSYLSFVASNQAKGKAAIVQQLTDTVKIVTRSLHFEKAQIKVDERLDIVTDYLTLINRLSSVTTELVAEWMQTNKIDEKRHVDDFADVTIVYIPSMNKTSVLYSCTCNYIPAE